MSRPKNFEYSFTDQNGNIFVCEIEDGNPATVTIRITDNNKERREEVLKECEGIGRILGVRTNRDEVRSTSNV